jgi:microcystin-dependent protein
MSDQFVGEIRMFAGNFAPTGWALCNGQILPISQNTALFSLLGTTYGGNGVNTFALPDLQGNSPLQAGQGPGLSLRDLGETGGENSVTLLQSEMPSHRHTVPVNGNDAADPTHNPPSISNPGNPFATSLAKTDFNAYGPGQDMTAVAAFGFVGGSQPHNNRQPYLAVNFIIALQGIFPPRG